MHVKWQHQQQVYGKLHGLIRACISNEPAFNDAAPLRFVLSPTELCFIKKLFLISCVCEGIPGHIIMVC